MLSTLVLCTENPLIALRIKLGKIYVPSKKIPCCVLAKLTVIQLNLRVHFLLLRLRLTLCFSLKFYKLYFLNSFPDSFLLPFFKCLIESTDLSTILMNSNFAEKSLLKISMSNCSSRYTGGDPLLFTKNRSKIRK